MTLMLLLAVGCGSRRHGDAGDAGVGTQASGDHPGRDAAVGDEVRDAGGPGSPDASQSVSSRREAEDAGEPEPTDTERFIEEPEPKAEPETNMTSGGNADAGRDPECRPSGTCSRGDGVDCVDREQAPRDCASCEILRGCGGLSCCDAVAPVAGVVSEWEELPELIAGYEQSALRVTLTLEFEDGDQMGAVTFRLSSAFEIDPATLVLDLDVVGDAVFGEPKVSLEDGSGDSGCLYGTTASAGGTKLDLTADASCWGEFDASSLVRQINVRIESSGAGRGELTLRDIYWTADAAASCEDTCEWAADGACDDGGPNSDSSACDHGTDCADCGVRQGEPEPQADLCTNECEFASDGDCDDGGHNSDFALCSYGTDCDDCGVRDAAQVNCSDTCVRPMDGVCDDGGSDADTDDCALGTDCADCGPRSGVVVDELCSDVCLWSADGFCDDGGPGSDYYACEFGTDCTDCGARPKADAIFDACSDTCEWAGDGLCDDGGPNADYEACDIGTDCADCGPRLSQ